MLLQNKASIRHSLDRSFVMIAGLVFAFFLLISSLLALQYKLESSNEWQFRSVMLALSLKESSADLAKNVRAYIATRDERYKEEYWNIVAVRQGEAPATVLENNTSYQLATQGLLVEQQGKVAFTTWLQLFNITAEELALIAEAERQSTTLIKLEEHAMNMVKDIYPDTDKHDKPEGEPNQAAALALLYSNDYNHALRNIQKIGDNFIERVNQRTEQEKKTYQFWVWVTSILLLIEIIGFVVFFIGYLRKFIRKQLIQPIVELAEASKDIAQGKNVNIPATDYTEMKQLVAGLQQIQDAQQAMEAHNQFIEQLMNDLPLGLLLIDKQDAITFANQQAYDLFKYPENTLLTYPIHDLLPDIKDMSTYIAHKTQAQQHDKQTFAAEISTSQIVRDSQTYTLVLISDIQAREMAEQRLKFTEFVIDKSPDIIFWVNTETGNITYADESAYESLGYESNSLLQKPISIIDPSIDNWQGLLSRLMDELLITRESVFLCANGSLMPVEVTWFLVTFGGRTTLIVSARDIRERKALEAEVAEQMAVVNQSRKATTNMLFDLEVAKQEVEAIHRHTRESIEYASLIQQALIPDEALFARTFSDHMAIWHPKDLVGGDIYFFTQLRHEDEVLLMVIDCTGHGVPGAFVTMLVKAIEQQIVTNIKFSQEEVSPAEILSIFNKTLKFLLQQESIDSVSNAGFDGAVIYYDRQKQLIKYASAEIQLFYTKDDQLLTVKSDRHSVGYKKSDANYAFTEYHIAAEKGMCFYLTTDGFLDQNGGEKGFPLGKKRFSQLITQHHQLPFAEQQSLFIDALLAYQGSSIRNDDVTLIGFKI